jgi:predicted nucleic acid-binding protein
MIELWNGARGERERREIAEIEKDITLCSVNSDVWQNARKLAIRCRDAGLTIPSSDIVIAACAANYGLEIEHCDARFERMLPLTSGL